MPTTEPRWISAEDIEQINGLEVEATGEDFGVLSRGLLHSAAGRPQIHWYYRNDCDVARLAAVLLEGIARNHCFAQGNKRTAATAAVLFMDLNGYEWVMPNSEEFGRWVVRLVERDLDAEQVAELMRPYVRPKPD